MARSRNSRSSSSSSSRKQSVTPAASQPTQVTQQPQPTQQPSMFANMASTMAGAAIGSTIGHTIGHGITGLFSSSSPPAETPAANAPPANFSQVPNASSCEPDQRAFMKCLDNNSNDITACQFYLDMLKQCQSSNTNSANW